MASLGAIGLVISLYMEMVRSNLSSSFFTVALNFSLSSKPAKKWHVHGLFQDIDIDHLVRFDQQLVARAR